MNEKPRSGFESSPCPMGCPSLDEELFSGHDRLHGRPGTFTVVRCRTCGLMRTNPRPSLEEMGFYYPGDYAPFHSTKVNDRRGSGSSTWWVKALARRVFQFNVNRIPVDLGSGRMLEIGCGSGVFLHSMARQGWDVAGIEPSAQAAANASALGYRVHAGPLETAPAPAHPYDLIVGWMVLEHLHRPLQALEKLHDWAASDGWLVMSVPNAASLEFRLFRHAWYALQLPTHLYHFTPRTVANLLAKGGWRVEKVYHHRVLSNVPPSLGYFLADRGLRGRMVEALLDFPKRGGHMHKFLYPVGALLAACGQTGRMTIWARKA